MRNQSKYVLLGLMLFTLMACDVIEDIVEQDIDVPVTFVLDLDIIVPENAEAPNTPTSFFAVPNAIDVLNIAEVSDRFGTPEQIQSIRITNVQYEYRNFSGNVDAVLSGSFNFFGGSPNTEVFYPTEPVNAAEADLLGDRFNLNGDYSPINEVLETTTVFAVGYDGLTSHNPVIVGVRLTISVTVTGTLNIDDL